jgi:hypothetical protein
MKKTIAVERTYKKKDTLDEGKRLTKDVEELFVKYISSTKMPSLLFIKIMAATITDQIIQCAPDEIEAHKALNIMQEGIKHALEWENR